MPSSSYFTNKRHPLKYHPWSHPGGRSRSWFRLRNCVKKLWYDHKWSIPCSVIWEPHADNNIHILAMLQHRAARFVIVFFFIVPGVSSVCYNSCNGWPYMKRLAGGVIMMFCIIKDHLAVGTSFIIPPGATVRGHNQWFLIPYTRTDMYRTFLVHRDNLTIIFHHATPLTPSKATCTTTDSTRFHLMCVILLYILPTLKWLLPTPVNRWTDTLVW